MNQEEYADISNVLGVDPSGFNLDEDGSINDGFFAMAQDVAGEDGIFDGDNDKNALNAKLEEANSHEATPEELERGMKR
jgi:hypothetical protein